jgi:hypothetical protein
MLPAVIRKETQRMQREWSPEERVARKRAGRQRCVQLWKLIHKPESKPHIAEPWATGAMTPADVSRIAG